jgi:DNA sulfur modification protein DndB
MMKKIAIRNKIGDWWYYLTSFTFNEVKIHVDPITDQVSSSTVLGEMLQRGITNNADKLKTYILQQEERFFNALVLAVYNGHPKWQEIRIENNKEEEFNTGFLTFNTDKNIEGHDIIIPLDGQHRVAGIKKALEENPDLADETIPVILIGHQNTQEGKRRSRRLFSTLNRYARPVSLSDIIALDEDDSVAIVTRYLVENNQLFEDGRLSNSKQRAIAQQDKKTLTNIQILYECNMELLKYFIDTNEVKIDGKKIKSNKAGLDRYIRFRRPDAEHELFKVLVNEFWTKFSEIEEISDYLSITVGNDPAGAYRNANGGNLLFRPVGQIPFVKTAIALFKSLRNWESVFERLREIPLDLEASLWTGIAWDTNQRKMITAKQSLVELLFKHFADETLLSDKEKNRMIQEYKTAKGMLPTTDAGIVLDHIGGNDGNCD